MNQTLELEIETQNESFFVDVDFTYHISYSGIGYYEWWGQKEYQNEESGASVDNCEWDRKSFTDEQNYLISKYIEEKLEYLEEKLTEEMYSV